MRPGKARPDRPRVLDPLGEHRDRPRRVPRGRLAHRADAVVRQRDLAKARGLARLEAAAHRLVRVIPLLEGYDPRLMESTGCPHMARLGTLWVRWRITKKTSSPCPGIVGQRQDGLAMPGRGERTRESNVRRQLRERTGVRSGISVERCGQAPLRLVAGPDGRAGRPGQRRRSGSEGSTPGA